MASLAVVAHPWAGRQKAQKGRKESSVKNRYETVDHCKAIDKETRPMLIDMEISKCKRSHSASTGSEEDALASSSGEFGQTVPAPSNASIKQRPVGCCAKAGKAIARAADMLSGIDGLEEMHASLKTLAEAVAELDEYYGTAKPKGKKKREQVGKVSAESAAETNAEQAEGGK